MPTQEERLTALERSFATFQKETAKYIQETDENITILLGVIRHQGQDTRRIVQHLGTIDDRLGTMDEHLGTMGEHLRMMDERLRTMDGRLRTMDEHLGTMGEHLNSIEQRLNRLETKSDEHTTLLTQILARLPKTP